MILVILLAALTLLPPFRSRADTELRTSAGKATVLRMCAGCHTVDVITSAAHTKQQWQTIVQDMVARGAVGSSGDVATATEYLALNYGAVSTGDLTKQEGEEQMRTLRGPVPAIHLDTKTPISRLEQWPVYGHDSGAQRHSPLQQITPANVSHLQRAWTFHMGKGGSESTPLVIDSVMYLTAPDAVFALEPETGKVLWRYASYGVARRGLVYWEGGEGISGYFVESKAGSWSRWMQEAASRRRASEITAWWTCALASPITLRTRSSFLLHRPRFIKMLS